MPKKKVRKLVKEVKSKSGVSLKDSQMMLRTAIKYAEAANDIRISQQCEHRKMLRVYRFGAVALLALQLLSLYLLA